MSKHKEKNPKDSLPTRIVEILKKLANGENLDLKSLEVEFNVSLRTLQRDIKILSQFIPIIKQNGFYTLTPLAFGTLSYADLKYFAILSGLKGMYPSLDSSFFMDLLNPDIAKALLITPQKYCTPDYNVFEKLSIAILSHHKISFEYKGRIRILEPYKIIHKQGIWYLLATELKKLKYFTLHHIQSLKINNNGGGSSQILES